MNPLEQLKKLKEDAIPGPWATRFYWDCDKKTEVRF